MQRRDDPGGRFAHDRAQAAAAPASAADRLVIPGYTRVMKTAISVPDETFDRASRRAKALGLSRSEFFARAAENYLDELDTHSVTRQIDAVLEGCGAVDDSNAVAVEAAHGFLRESDDEW